MNNEVTFEEAVTMNGLKMDIEAIMKERDDLKAALEKKNVEHKQVTDWWLKDSRENDALKQQIEALNSELKSVRDELENAAAETDTIYADKRFHQGRADGMLEALAVIFGGEADV